MQSKVFFQRAGLRGGLALGAAFGSPITAGGQAMDPVMSALVRFARASGRPTEGLAALRRRYAGAAALTGLLADPSVSVVSVQAGPCPARRYRPAGRVHASMLFFHGGGFILGGVDTHDALCRLLAARAGLHVVSVEYRLAPEHPFPAAHEDAAGAWDWAQATLPGPLMVGGDSAGANLAAGLALGGGARLQALLYPVVDMLNERGRYPSLDRFGAGFLLTADAMQECMRLLLPHGQDAGAPLLSPVRAELSRAAPALIMTAGFDPLHDQGVAYAEALRAAGVPGRLLDEPRLVHGFADFAGVVPAARRGLERFADAIRAELLGEAAASPLR
ncbi:MAG: alpha/beta hydrolase [Acetobacteraceae bacterium]